MVKFIAIVCIVAIQIAFLVEGHRHGGWEGGRGNGFGSHQGGRRPSRPFRPCDHSSSGPAQNATCNGQTNEQIVKTFFQGLFGDKNFTVIDEYIVEDFIQHNPIVPDGREGLRAFATGALAGAPKSQIEFWRTASVGNMVWLHTGTVNLEAGTNNGNASVGVDIFRVENCKLVEHWDVLQDVTGPFANSHPMN